MSDEEKSKVISFETRRVVQQEPAEPEAEKVEIDEETLEVATTFQEMVAEGEISGALVVGWCPKTQSFYSEFVLPNDDHADISSAKFIGYLEAVKVSMLQIMTDQIIISREEP